MKFLCEACGAEQVVEGSNVSVAECEECGEPALVPRASASGARHSAASDRPTGRPSAASARPQKSTLAGLGAGGLAGADADLEEDPGAAAPLRASYASAPPARSAGKTRLEDEVEDDLDEEPLEDEERLEGDLDEEPLDEEPLEDEERLEDDLDEEPLDEEPRAAAGRSAVRRPERRPASRTSGGSPVLPALPERTAPMPPSAVDSRSGEPSLGRWLEARGPLIAAFLVASAACFVLGRWTIGGAASGETPSAPAAPAEPSLPPPAPEHAPAEAENAEPAPAPAPQVRKKTAEDVELSGPIDAAAKLTDDEGDEASEVAEAAEQGAQPAGSGAESAPSAKAGGDEPGPFDASVVTRALSQAASHAATCAGKGPNGSGSVSLTVMPDGTVEDVYVSAPFDGTEVGACVLDHFRFVRVPVFSGAPVKTYKSFVVSSDRSVDPTPVKLRPGEPPRPLADGKG